SCAAVSKSGLLIDHDRTIRGFSDECESFIGTGGCAIVAEGRVENCGILRQGGYSLAQLTHRQASEVDDLHVLGECRKFVLVVTSISLLGEGIAHDCNPFEPRHERLRRDKRLGYWPLNRRSSYIG